jgi:hypothetical protein
VSGGARACNAINAWFGARSDGPRLTEYLCNLVDLILGLCDAESGGHSRSPAGRPMTDQRRAPSARTWVVAALELVGALVLARILVWTDRPAGQHQGRGMAPMPGMADATAPQPHWTWPVYAAAVVAATSFIWWVLRGQAVAAVVGPIAVTICVASYPVRTLAAQSHLVAMIVLEVLLILVPLSILTALPHAADTGSTGNLRAGWMLLAGGSALAYAVLLIAIHLPGVHHHGGAGNVVPLWPAIAAPMIGIGYWFGVLRTAAVLSLRTRRASLFAVQEIAALVGLLSVFSAWGSPGHGGPLGISAAWDQALGGLVMMATCAAVAIPIAGRMHT